MLDLGDAEFFQCLQPQMAVQKEPGSGVLSIRHDARRFDQADRIGEGEVVADCDWGVHDAVCALSVDG